MRAAMSDDAAPLVAAVAGALMALLMVAGMVADFLTQQGTAAVLGALGR